MYWQKRFDKENPDKEPEEKILEIQVMLGILEVLKQGKY